MKGPPGRSRSALQRRNTSIDARFAASADFRGAECDARFTRCFQGLAGMFLRQGQEPLQNPRPLDAPRRKHRRGPLLSLVSNQADLAQQIAHPTFQAADLLFRQVLAVSAEAAWLAPHMHGDLFPAVVEDADLTREVWVRWDARLVASLYALRL